MSGFGGRYPGGPRRRAEGEEPPRRPDLEGLGEFEERVARQAGRRHAKRRARKVRIGFLVALLVSGAIGLMLGYMSHQTPEELAAERERARQEFNASEEVNRVLLELWKMEDLERMDLNR